MSILRYQNRPKTMRRMIDRLQRWIKCWQGTRAAAWWPMSPQRKGGRPRRRGGGSDNSNRSSSKQDSRDRIGSYRFSNPSRCGPTIPFGSSSSSLKYDRPCRSSSRSSSRRRNDGGNRRTPPFRPTERRTPGEQGTAHGSHVGSADAHLPDPQEKRERGDQGERAGALSGYELVVSFLGSCHGRHGQSRGTSLAARYLLNRSSHCNQNDSTVRTGIL